MLLKTVGRNPDLFCYYVSIQEAKELLKDENPKIDSLNNNLTRPIRIVTDC